MANEIKSLVKQKKDILCIDITNLEKESKDRLKGALKFFAGDRTNMALQIKDENGLKTAGAIYLTQQILEELIEIVGENNISYQ